MSKPTAEWSNSEATANRRSVLSLVIALHILIVGLSLLCSVQRSELHVRLTKVLATYSRSLFFVPSDSPYVYVAEGTRYGNRVDDDHLVEVEANGEVVTFPSAGSNWSLNRRRWFRLNRQLGWFSEDSGGDEACAVLAQEFAWQEMQIEGAPEEVLVHCKRRMAQPFNLERDLPADLPADDPTNRKYESTVYTAQVYVVDGELQVAKKSATREVAPRTPGAASATGENK